MLNEIYEWKCGWNLLLTPQATEIGLPWYLRVVGWRRERKKRIKKYQDCCCGNRAKECSCLAQTDLELIDTVTKNSFASGSVWKKSVYVVVVSPDHRGSIGDHGLCGSFWRSTILPRSDNGHIPQIFSIVISTKWTWTRPADFTFTALNRYAPRTSSWIVYPWRYISIYNLRGNDFNFKLKSENKVFV